MRHKDINQNHESMLPHGVNEPRSFEGAITVSHYPRNKWQLGMIYAQKRRILILALKISH